MISLENNLLSEWGGGKPTVATQSDRVTGEVFFVFFLVAVFRMSKTFHLSSCQRRSRRSSSTSQTAPSLLETSAPKACTALCHGSIRRQEQLTSDLIVASISRAQPGATGHVSQSLYYTCVCNVLKGGKKTFITFNWL